MGRRDIFIIWNLNRIVIDNSGCQQDNSCIYFLETAGMRENPNYGLYTTQGLDHWVDSVHIENIPTRSSLNHWIIKPHLHKSFIQMLYLTHGGGVVGIGDESIQVKAPCILSIPEQIMHSFHFTSDVDGPVITAVQHVLERMIGAADPAMLSMVREPFAMELEPGDPALQPVGPLFDAIQEEFRSRRVGQPGICMSLLSALVLRLAHGGEGLPTDATAADGGYATFVRFHQAVERDFARTRRVEDYARALGYSVRTLTRACLAATGHPAKEYIDARVVLEAKRQLVHTSTPVLAIAADLGFRDASDFTKFFRRRDPDGRTPAEFRAIAGGRARGGR